MPILYSCAPAGVASTTAAIAAGMTRSLMVIVFPPLSACSWSGLVRRPVAAAARCFQQHDIVGLEHQLFRVVHRLAADQEAPRCARLAAAEALGPFVETARPRGGEALVFCVPF